MSGCDEWGEHFQELFAAANSDNPYADQCPAELELDTHSFDSEIPLTWHGRLRGHTFTLWGVRARLTKAAVGKNGHLYATYELDWDTYEDDDPNDP